MKANPIGQRARKSLACLLPLLALGEVRAADENFQQFLFDACNAPNGLLAQRCGETIAGSGDVSAASESSLNPSQFLAGNSASLASTYSYGEDARGAGGPGADEFPGGTRLDIGPFGLSLNGRWLDESRSAGDDGGARPYELVKKSVQAGVDYRFGSGAMAGLLISAENSRLSFDNGNAVQVQLANAGRVEIDGVGASVYASFSSESGHRLDIGLGYTDNDYTLERRAVFEPVNPMVQDPVPTVVEAAADSTGEDRWATLNWSRPVTLSIWSFEPFVGLTWTETTLDAYAERDLSQSGLALRTDGLETSSVTGTAGFDARRVVSTEVAVLVPQLRAAYTWEFETDATLASSRFLLDSSESVLVTRDRERDRDALELGAGMVAVFPRGWSLFVDARTTLGLLDRDRWVVSLGWRVEL